jgi:hypothetical protein
MPNDPQSKITGKPMTVAELLAGTRSSAARNQLLPAYWELSGLLAVYHFRCETERQATRAQEGMMTLLREQRRTAEVEFVKQQWVLAELIKQYKGQAPHSTEMPIPADFPLYPRYQTHADKIARSERTQYLARMISIQEQLIESKNGTWKAASAMANLRTTAFLDLNKAIVEYNKMIAEYALETIPPNVSHQQLVGAVVRLPKHNSAPEQPQFPQMATQGITLTNYDAPISIPAQPVAQIGSEFQITPASITMPMVAEAKDEIFLPPPAILPRRLSKFHFSTRSVVLVSKSSEQDIVFVLFGRFFRHTSGIADRAESPSELAFPSREAHDLCAV